VLRSLGARLDAEIENLPETGEQVSVR
jgi:hypothetical protein